jgi:hypothetical protein
VNLTAPRHASTWPEPTSRQIHWLLVATALMLAAVAIAGGILNAAPWRWSLFVGGVAIGVLGIGHNEFVTRFGSRVYAVPRERRIRIGSRPLSYTLMWVGLGPLVGGLAAAWSAAWIDVAVGAYAAVVWVLSLIVLFFADRRANNSPFE